MTACGSDGPTSCDGCAGWEWPQSNVRPLNHSIAANRNSRSGRPCHIRISARMVHMGPRSPLTGAVRRVRSPDAGRRVQSARCRAPVPAAEARPREDRDPRLRLRSTVVVEIHAHTPVSEREPGISTGSRYVDAPMCRPRRRATGPRPPRPGAAGPSPTTARTPIHPSGLRTHHTGDRTARTTRETAPQEPHAHRTPTSRPQHAHLTRAGRTSRAGAAAGPVPTSSTAPAASWWPGPATTWSASHRWRP